VNASAEAAPAFFGLETKDILTIVGFIVSIGLGLYNLHNTKKIRKGTIVIEELRSQIRDPMQKQLDVLLEARKQFAALAKPNGFKLDELRNKVSDPVTALEFALLTLGDLLQKADASKFAKGSNWDSTFRANMDTIQTHAEKISSPKITLKDLGVGLASIIGSIATFDRALRERLEAEVGQHLP
jgi:hypothetical protein